jgi:hypothetical protein
MRFTYRTLLSSWRTGQPLTFYTAVESLYFLTCIIGAPIVMISHSLERKRIPIALEAIQKRMDQIQSFKETVKDKTVYTLLQNDLEEMAKTLKILEKRYKDLY